MVLSSTDGWDSHTVHTAYSAACESDGPTTLAIAPNSDAMTMCPNSCEVAPYAVTVLKDIVSGNRLEMPTSSVFSTNADYPEGIEYDSNLN